MSRNGNERPKILSYLLFVCLLLGVIPLALRFSSENAEATVVMENETFESYENGETNLGSDWTSSHVDFLVQTSVFKNGAQALRLYPSGAGQWYSSMTHMLAYAQTEEQTLNATYTFWVRHDDLSTDFCNIYWWDSVEGQLSIYSSMKASLGYRVWDGISTPVTITATLTNSVWYGVYMALNSTAHKWYCAISSASMPTAPTHSGAWYSTAYDIDSIRVNSEYQDYYYLDDFMQTNEGATPIIAGSPETTVLTDTAYSFNATCSPADVGSLDWSLTTNATWLAIDGSPDGTAYCNLSGVAQVGTYWVDLSVNDSDSLDWLNWTVTVNAMENRWGVYAMYCAVEESREVEALALAFAPVSMAELAGSDYTIWEKKGIILTPGDGDPSETAWEVNGYQCNDEPTIFYEDGIYKVWYRGSAGYTAGIGFAESTDLLNWQKFSGNPILGGGGAEPSLAYPYVLKEAGEYWLYCCVVGATNQYRLYQGTTETDLTAYASNPVLTLGSAGQWDSGALGNMCVWKEDAAHWYMLYEAFKSGFESWKIGLATSPDGKAWTKYDGNPVIDRGTKCAGGPFLQKVESTWVLWFQGAPDGGTSLPTNIYKRDSTDLHVWANETLVMERSYTWEGSQVADISLLEVNIIEPELKPGHSSPIQASFSYSIDGLKVTFTDKSYGLITLRVWNFGDGIGSTNPYPTHKYEHSGTYTIILTVLDDMEHSSIAMTTVKVGLGPTTPLERTDMGWSIYLGNDTILSVSAIGLLVSGGISVASSWYLPEIPIVTRKARRLFGLLMIGAGVYYLLFVKGLVFGGFG